MRAVNPRLNRVLIVVVALRVALSLVAFRSVYLLHMLVGFCSAQALDVVYIFLSVSVANV